MTEKNKDTSSAEDMKQYYNEGPFGPDGKERSLSQFFHTRWSPSGGGGGGCQCAFDQECKGYLKTIKEKVEEGITPFEDRNVVHFMGLVDHDPTSGEPLHIGGQPYEPRDNDIVRFQKKEFMYKDGEWEEIGDEDALAWNED